MVTRPAKHLKYFKEDSENIDKGALTNTCWGEGGGADNPTKLLLVPKGFYEKRGEVPTPFLISSSPSPNTPLVERNLGIDTS